MHDSHRLEILPDVDYATAPYRPGDRVQFDDQTDPDDVWTVKGCAPEFDEHGHETGRPDFAGWLLTITEADGFVHRYWAEVDEMSAAIDEDVPGHGRVAVRRADDYDDDGSYRVTVNDVFAGAIMPVATRLWQAYSVSGLKAGPETRTVKAAAHELLQRRAKV